MSQISRPFQIALAAVGLLALVWVLALHRPSSESKSSAESPATPVAPATTAATPNAGSGASAGSGGAGIYHGSAPGVEGLSKAIAKAHGAVATSQQNAQQLKQKSEQASANTGQGASSTPAGGTSSSKSASSSASASTPSTHAAPKTSTHAAPKTAPHSSSAPAVMPRQRLVERELAHGDIVALLLWSRTGADDKAVRSSLYQLAGREHSLDVHVAPAKEVASFGTITRGIQVYGTPTVLLVGKHGRTLVLTGLQDAFAIRQAVSEVRHP